MVQMDIKFVIKRLQYAYCNAINTKQNGVNELGKCQTSYDYIEDARGSKIQFDKNT